MKGRGWGVAGREWPPATAASPPYPTPYSPLFHFSPTGCVADLALSCFSSCSRSRRLRVRRAEWNSCHCFWTSVGQDLIAADSSESSRLRSFRSSASLASTFGGLSLPLAASLGGGASPRFSDSFLVSSLSR